MKNIYELESLGYTIKEDPDGLILRINNSYGDTVCSVFKRSRYSYVSDGKIFNFFSEVKEGLKNVDSFLEKPN